MPRIVLDAELLAHDFDDPCTGPQVGLVSGRQRAVDEHLDERLLLLVGQLGDAAGVRLRGQRRDAPPRSTPAANASRWTRGR